MAKLAGAVLIVAAQIASLLCIVGTAAAQNATPSSHPQLIPYNDWVNDNIAREYARYWRIYDGGAGREPYVVYCADELFAEDAIVGRNVRARLNSEAAAFFSRVSGQAVVALPSSEINTAFELRLIDCIGFGGEIIEASTPPSDPSAFDAGVVDAVARSLGVEATDETFQWEPGTLEWSIYRATNGDLNEIYHLYTAYQTHGVSTNAPPFVHMAGFWAVRAMEHTDRGGIREYDDLFQATTGNCAGQIELCRAIQIELKRIGRYDGAIDGIIGRDTRRAIRAIFGTRQAGDLGSLASLDEFLAARRPVAADVKKPSDKGGIDVQDTEPPAVPDPLPTLPENLDDF